MSLLSIAVESALEYRSDRLLPSLWMGGLQTLANYDDWVQFKVSAILIAFGFACAYGIIRLGSPSAEEVVAASSAKVQQVWANTHEKERPKNTRLNARK